MTKPIFYDSIYNGPLVEMLNFDTPGQLVSSATTVWLYSHSSWPSVRYEAKTMMLVDILCTGHCWQDVNCVNACYKSHSAFKGFALQKSGVFVYMSVNFGMAYSKHTVRDQDKKKKKSRSFLQGQDMYPGNTV